MSESTKFCGISLHLLQNTSVTGGWMPKVHYVYSIRWPDAVYHGYSSNVFRRMKEHRSRCRDGDELVAVQEHYDAHGIWTNVEFRQFDSKEDALACERELVNDEAGEAWCLNRERIG